MFICKAMFSFTRKNMSCNECDILYDVNLGIELCRVERQTYPKSDRSELVAVPNWQWDYRFLYYLWCVHQQVLHIEARTRQESVFDKYPGFRAREEISLYRMTTGECPVAVLGSPFVDRTRFSISINSRSRGCFFAFAKSAPAELSKQTFCTPAFLVAEISSRVI
jgi:hypothetical protein